MMLLVVDNLVVDNLVVDNAFIAFGDSATDIDYSELPVVIVLL
ncbi:MULTISPECIES: hypothetical protein [unclassified Moorena]|nr:MULTISPECIES: hypothetical protein [unclassified Moorena]